MTIPEHSHTGEQLARSLNMKYSLILEGLLVGICAALVAVLYRLVLDYAEKGLHGVLGAAKSNWMIAVAWFALLILMALAAGWLVKKEPMISGSGIPQVEGEMAGHLDQKWWRVMIGKFIGGALCIFGGLSLGREGPSVQLGAMAGKGISKGFKRIPSETRFLISCGASAGLSAAFNAPLAGIIFAIEEIHKTFSVQALLSVMTASITADFISKNIFGLSPIFHFPVEAMMPLQHYWLVILLGVVLGVMGVVYNKVTLKSQELYGKLKWLKPQFRLLLPFLVSGALGFLMPEVLGGGHTMMDLLADGKLFITGMLVLFLVKFLFSSLCFGSGAPGGIFFPLMVLGAYLGGAFGLGTVSWLGLDPAFVNNFIILAMAGYFTAIVRAPITGIVLVSEMSGSLSHLLSLATVSIVAYVTAEAFKSAPIYESLLERILKNREIPRPPQASGERSTVERTVEVGSILEQCEIRTVEWPKDCLLVSVRRGSAEVIPKGDTKLLPGDILVALTDRDNRTALVAELESLCRCKEI